MKLEIEALGRLVDVASELEVGIAELAQDLEGDAQSKAIQLRDVADKLADGLTAVYIEMAKQEAASEGTQEVASGSTES
jgi:hypothetical protein